MSENNEHIAYRGQAFCVEWYFNSNGKSPSLEYYLSLNNSERIQLLKLFKRIGDSGEIKNKTKFNYEGDKIYAFKPKPDRFLCFFYDGGKIIVTNAFRKKQQKLPGNEKDKAVSFRKEYISREKIGEYYEQ